MCAKARVTVSIIVTTPRRGASKKAKIKERTSQATSKGTRAINIDRAYEGSACSMARSLASPAALITAGAGQSLGTLAAWGR